MRSRTVRVPVSRPIWSPRPRLLARLLDDHDLVSVKLALITLLIMAAVALEVPW